MLAVHDVTNDMRVMPELSSVQELQSKRSVAIIGKEPRNDGKIAVPAARTV
jgi:hypothetical protein